MDTNTPRVRTHEVPADLIPSVTRLAHYLHTKGIDVSALTTDEIAASLAGLTPAAA